MRSTTRLFALIYKNTPIPKGSTSYLVPHNPTGLTGMLTHPFPRPILIQVYTETLSKLSQLPVHSVYRQATEAVTRARLAIIESTIPPGFEEWSAKTAELVKQHPEVATEGRSFKTSDGKDYVLPVEQHSADDRVEEWDGETVTESRGEGPRTMQERRMQARDFGEGRKAEDLMHKDVEVVNEPPLTAEQVNSIEQQIGAGLLEEVISVAQGELELVETMLEHKVWEELEEKPVQDQWTYFPRDRGTGITQAPPSS